jgi:phospholipase D1/2
MLVFFHGFLFFLIQGEGDSEIALVVEDDDMINSTMNGMPYPVARFATTLRRQLYKGN